MTVIVRIHQFATVPDISAIEVKRSHDADLGFILQC